MPIIKGTHVQRQSIEVEISNRDLNEAVIKAIIGNNPDLRDLEYIDIHGNRMVLDFVSHHNGDDEYKSDGPATANDRKFLALKTALWELLK